jgi:hypothetical protein
MFCRGVRIGENLLRVAVDSDNTAAANRMEGNRLALEACFGHCPAMDATLKSRGEARLEAALETSDTRDPRGVCRERLRWLKDNQRSAFERALEHYEQVLVPNAARDQIDPIGEWEAYARLLGELSGVGRTVDIDETGHAGVPGTRLRGLTLHIPDDSATPVLVVRMPNELSAAQRATIDLLVDRRQRLSETAS